MVRKYVITIIYVLACQATALADDREKTLFAAATQASPQWQQTSTAMQPRDYTRTTATNQRIMQQGLTVYADRLLEKSGAYGPAVGLLGTAVVLSASDRTYHLNDSKTVGVTLRDTTSSKRTVLLEFRTSW